MIRIERGEEVDGPNPEKRRHGIWEYRASRYPLVCGYSRQPLLDACRQLKSLYGLTGKRVGLFREGSEIADISCTIEAGAATTVKEPDNGLVRFGKYRAFEPIAGSKKPPMGECAGIAPGDARNPCGRATKTRASPHVRDETVAWEQAS